MTNGNVMFNFNLGNLPKGRGSAGGGISLKYNSKLYTSQYNEVTGPNGQPNPELFLTDAPESGWQYDEGGYRLKAISRNDGSDEPTQTSGACGKPNYKGVYTWKVMLYFPDGSQHEFRPTGYSDTDQNTLGQLQTGDGYFNVSLSGGIRNLVWSGQQSDNPNCGFMYSTQVIPSQHSGSTLTYYSSDGTYMRLIVPTGQNERYPSNWTVYMPDGSKIVNSSSHGQRVYDRNGNYIEKGNVTLPDSSQASGLFDQFGRYVAKKQISTLEDQIYSLGTAGETLKWTIKWKHISVVRRYRTSSADQIERGGSNQLFCSYQKVVDEIIPPEQIGNLKYSFTYKATDGNAVGCNVNNPTFSPGWGELSKVTLPSGAEAEYKYALLSLPGETSNSPGAVLPYTKLMLKSLGKIKEKTLSYNSEYDGAVTPMTEKWIYDIDDTSSKITSPDGSISQQGFRASGDKAGSVYREKKPDGTIIERLWLNNQPNGFLFGSYRKLNKYVKTEFTTIPDAAGNPYLTAIKDFSYDKNGNVTKITEYDWVSPGSVPHDGNGEVSGIPANASVLRTTENTYHNQTEDAANTTVNNSNSYWNSSAQLVINALLSTKIKNASGGVVSYSEFSYDNPNTTANLIETRAWDSTKPQAITYPLTSANAVISSVEYDIYGNPVQTTDARGVQTAITYGAVNGYTGLYPTQTEAASNYITLKRTSTAQYDFYTGLVLSATDVDNNITSKTEYDGLGRPIKSIHAYNSPLEIWTQTVYDNVNRRIIVKSDIETKGDAKKVATQFYDQLGRVRLSKTLENAAQSATNETDGIKVQTRYLTTNGYTYQLTSNPYRAATTAAATGELEMGWTRSKTINTGKHSEIETFAGAVLPAPWGNSSNSTGIVQTDIAADRTLVTDQAGKQRISKTNVFGQLADIWEITAADSSTEAITFANLNLNGYRTSYDYDTLNNLINVKQGGTIANPTQLRTFAYDSLSRLKSVNNPESGLIQYTYDNNGNLLTKTDARTITTTYIYDALNRVTFRDYSDSTHDVAYVYDNLPNAKGKLTKVMNGPSSNGVIANPFSVTEYQQFNSAGRVTQSQQFVDGAAYPNMTYTYNLSGALVEQKYPSGRVVKNVLDNEGDLSIVQSKKNQTAGFWNYADNFTYTATGAVKSMQLGNGKWESTAFNSRLQPTQITLGTIQNGTDKLELNFDYGTTNNNGNVLSQTIIVPIVGTTAGFTAVQTYTYDSLNRLKSATENKDGNPTPEWKQTFDYDRYGNRTFNEAGTTDSANFPKMCGTAPNLTMCAAVKNIYNPQSQTSNNKFSTSDGYQYDSVGNTTRDAQNRRFTYDAESKQTKVETVDSNGNIIAILGEYFYDGNGKRVKKVVPGIGETTIFIYDVTGKLVAENSTLPSPTQTVSYLTNDHLGSPRVNTDQNGVVMARHDYQPFGAEIQRASYSTDQVRKQFTGYERDKETALDFAQARMFGSSLGRFTSPDPYKIVAEVQDEENAENAEAMLKRYISQPQQWNQYVYTINNPLKFVDPTGEVVYLTGTAEEQKAALERIKNLLGADRYSWLSIGTKNDEKAGNVTVLSLSEEAMKKMDRIGTGEEGQFSVRMSDIFGSKEVVEYRLAETFTTSDGSVKSTLEYGGAATLNKAESPTGNIQIFVHPTKALTKVESVFSTPWGRAKSSDGGALYFTNEIIDAHEFGHAYVGIHGGLVDGGPGNDTAVQMENNLRERQKGNVGSRRRTAH